MADASLDPIRQRLYGIEPYHPVEAETFADWTLEAGDVVTFKRGDEDPYESPVHTARMVWKGAPQISVNSTGSKEREAVAKVSKKKYRSGGGALRNEQWLHHEFYSEDGYLHSELSMTESVLRTEFTNAYYGLQSEFELTASHLWSHFESVNSALSTTIEQTQSHIYAEAINRENADVQLQGQLDIQADRASLVVTATDTRSVKTYLSISDFPSTGSTSYLYYDVTNKKYYEWKNGAYSETTPGNVIDRGGIITTINQDNTATTQILGSKVYIGGLTEQDLNTWAADAYSGRGVFAKYLTVKQLSAQDLTTLLANIGDATIGIIEVKNNSESTVIQPGGITTAEIDVATINDADVDDLLASADISGDVLTFTNVAGDETTITKSEDGTTLTFRDSNGNSFTFNKAASTGVKLRPNWSGDTLLVSKDTTGEETYSTVISTGFTSHPGPAPSYATQYFIAGYKQDAGSSTVTEVTNKQYYLGVVDSTPTVVRVINPSTGNYYSDTSTYTIPLQSELVVESNTGDTWLYPTNSRNVGFAKVKVNVPIPAPVGTSIDPYTTLSTGSITSGTGTGAPSSTFTLTPGKYQQSQQTSAEVACVTLGLNWGSGNKNIGRVAVPLQSDFEVTSNSDSWLYPSESGKLGFSRVKVNVQFPEPYGASIDEHTEKKTGTISTGTATGAPSKTFTLSAGTYHPPGITANVPEVTLSLDGTNIGRINFPLEARTGASKITSNNTYNPSTGYLGFSQVVVDVPLKVTGDWTNNVYTAQYSATGNSTATTTVGSGFRYTSNKYYAVATRYVSENNWAALTGSYTEYKLALDTNKTKIQVQNASGTKYSDTPEVALTLDTGSCTAGARTRTVKVKAGGDNTEVKADITDYTTGWSDAYGNVSVPSTQSLTASMKVRTPKSAPDQTPTTYNETTFTLSSDNSYVYLKNGSTTVARTGNDAYKNGWAAAREKIEWPSENTSSTLMKVKVPASLPTSVPIQNEVGFTVSVNTSAKAQIKMGSVVVAQCDVPLEADKEFTENTNGWVAPTSSTNVGFNRVKVAVPLKVKGEWNENVYTVTYDASGNDDSVTEVFSSGFRKTSNKYYTVATRSVSAGSWAAITGSYTEYKLALDTGKTKIQVQNSSGSPYSGDTPEVPLSLDIGSCTAGARTRTVKIKADGNNTNVTANITDYATGWGNAFSKVSVPSTSSYGASMTVSTPPSTVDGDANSVQFDLSEDKNYVYIKNHSNAQTVARVSNTQYGNGWTAAYTSVASLYPTATPTTLTSNLKVPIPNTTVDGSATYKNYYLKVEGSAARIRYNNATSGNIVAETTIPLEEHEFTTSTSGWYYPQTSGNVGFSRVKVTVSTPAPPAPSGSAIGDHVEVKTGSISSGTSSSTFTLTPGTYRPTGSTANVPEVTLNLGGTNIGRAAVPLTIDTGTRSGSSRTVTVKLNGTSTNVTANITDYDDVANDAGGNAWLVSGTTGGNVVETLPYFSDAAKYVHIIYNDASGNRHDNSTKWQLPADRYGDGWTAAYNSVNGHYPTTEQTSSDELSIPKPNSTVDGGYNTLPYYVTADSQHAYIKYVSKISGTIVAQCDVPGGGVSASDTWIYPAGSYTTATTQGFFGSGDYITSGVVSTGDVRQDLRWYCLKAGLFNATTGDQTPIAAGDLNGGTTYTLAGFDENDVVRAEYMNFKTPSTTTTLSYDSCGTKSSESDFSKTWKLHNQSGVTQFKNFWKISANYVYFAVKVNGTVHAYYG